MLLFLLRTRGERCGKLYPVQFETVPHERDARRWDVVKFRPSFSLWPRPQFLADSGGSLNSWMTRRDAPEGEERDEHIRQIIEDYHDQNGRTIYPPRRRDR